MKQSLSRAMRIVAFVVCAAASVAAGFAPAGVWAQGGGQRPQNPPPKKKKLPPGVRGFESFANRDASDKLIVGGATRDACMEKNFQAWIKCGTGFYEAGEYASAADAFREAIKLGPERFRGHYLLGMAAEALGQYKEAVAAYQKAVSLKPEAGIDDPEDALMAQYNLANSYALSDRHADAIKAYERLIASLPTPLSKPYYNLGLSQAALGQKKQAYDAFRKAVELKPDFAEAHYNLGLLHARDEQYAEAAAEFQKAIKSNPDYAEARYNLGLVYYLTDNRAGLAEQQKALQDMKSKLAPDLARLGAGEGKR